jgi:hypothetical protein
MKPLPLTVAAVLAPDPNEKSSLFNDQQTPPLSDAVGIGLGQERTGLNGILWVLRTGAP